jgi:methyl-accepting chemotaxis protein
MKTLTKKISDFLKPNIERKTYREEFQTNLNLQARALQRPLGFIAAVAWINFAFNIDPKLHPEFPELFYFRMVLTVAGALVFIASFFEKIRGKGLGWIYFLATFSLLSCSFFTGRLAGDAGYVSGLQILVIIIIAAPFLLRTIFTFYIISIALFVAAVLLYHPVLSTDAAMYSMNNLVLSYVVAFALAWVLDRYRFNSFLNQLKLNRAKDTAEASAWAKNEFLAKMSQEIMQPMNAVMDLSSLAKDQGSTMERHVESTTSVAKSVKEITDVTGELVQTVQQVASMTKETSRLATGCQTDLVRMKRVIQGMGEASMSISRRLETINEKAGNITNVVTTISKVADQTNLLSLNAALEAEKAGKYGRGFYVVAREIRRLADQTAVSTLEIEQMVKEMQSAVFAGVMEMDKFITSVQESTKDVDVISTQLNSIIGQVQALSPSFEGVNEAMKVQSENARQINTAMVDLTKEMQQITKALRDNYSSIEQLGEAANRLQDEVSRFKEK